MPVVRVCPNCGKRVRLPRRKANRSRTCPYCQTTMPGDWDADVAGRLTRAEMALWVMGYLTQALGLALAATLLLAHERFALSLLGGVLVGIIMGGLFWVVGHGARRGSTEEIVWTSLLAMILFLGLTLYGALIWEPVDALGATFALILGAGAVVHSQRHVDVKTGIVWDPAMLKLLGFLYLLFFLGVYVYLGLKPWIGR